ncbi:MAG: sensor histidine kinase, partial [Burkholderiales bacterium]|nr:sensor histidine kinase [Burkholderiales bacterium]
NLSSVIEEILLEKKYVYKNLNIKFFYIPPIYVKDCLIQSENDDLKRMLSNIINNAVEACDENGIIHVSLELKNKILYLNIVDNGKGMPDEVLQKLRNSITITFGKENGQGIGLGQIRETVTKLCGSLTIKSILGIGTEIQIILPCYI